MPKTKQQPVHEVRFGAIKATIWENQTSVGIRNNVTVPSFDPTTASRVVNRSPQFLHSRRRVMYPAWFRVRATSVSNDLHFLQGMPLVDSLIVQLP
jgi:hypothetical protein